MNIGNYIAQLRQCKDNMVELDRKISTQIHINRYKEWALTSTDTGVCSEYYCEFPIIVSLSTYGKRLQEVYLAIESMMHQTLKPNKIVLALSEEFKGSWKIPELVNRQTKRGLEILFCEDVRSFTKLLPTLKKYPQSIIVTIDDDIIYPIDFLEYLVKAYLNDPTHIYCYYGYTMSVDKSKLPDSYDVWIKNLASGNSIYNLPTGVDGILYPPHCLHEDVQKKEIYLELCPYADDLWFKCMSMINNVSVEVVPRAQLSRKEFIDIDSAVSISLARINRDQNMNDVQARKLFERYHLSDWFCPHQL